MGIRAGAGPPLTMSRVDVTTQAQRMIAVLGRDHPHALALLATDALMALQAWDELTVQLVPDSQTDARCSVAGGYIADTDPPTLSVTRSLSPGRRTFTALHELGHHLQQTDPHLAASVREHTDPMAFEDAACDAFAARILI